MAEGRTPPDFEFAAGDEVEPLVPADAGCESGSLDLEYDESGELVGAAGRRGEPRPPLFRPCSLRALNGSWLLEFSPAGPARGPRSW